MIADRVRMRRKSRDKYVLATDADFSGAGDGFFVYIGSDNYVIIPHKIKGMTVTRMYNTSTVGGMFGINASIVKGVATLEGHSITNMSSMFRESSATTLDLSRLDTSNVTNMSTMFYNSSVTTLDLSSFDTSNVTNMDSMFRATIVTTLDLSSFDTSKVTGMSYMFRDSLATTGYARTQADADRFNASSYKPAGLNFVVKIATDADFSGAVDGQFVYIGSDNYVIIPHKIKGITVTTTFGMFGHNASIVKGVATLEGHSITSMNGMFYGSQATSLDLSGFDTSNVTNMSYMFSDSIATTLDLSSFDTSNVINTINMFANSQATTGYARTQTDANKFNESSNKPAGLYFGLK